jgi:toxin-antitoxin system PIN domain toxin
VIPDVNVVVAAFRVDHAQHQSARRWFEPARRACAEGGETLVLLPVVLAGFLRLVTNARVFQDPDPVQHAVGFIDSLIDSPGVQIRNSTDEWPLLRDKLLTLDLAGNIVMDAAIAAMVQALNEHFVTFDRNFKRLLPKRDLTLLSPSV